jgi:allantoinase
VAGGITTLVEMPLNASPVTTTGAAYDQKLAAAAGKLHCDCGFWGGVVPGNEGEIGTLIGKGVLGFKAFLTHSGIDEFPNVTEADLRKVMPVIAAAGLPLLVHCGLEVWKGRRSMVVGLVRDRRWQLIRGAIGIICCRDRRAGKTTRSR